MPAPSFFKTSSLKKIVALRAALLSVRRCLAGPCADRAGGTLVALALSLSVIAGFAGLGTEAASWYLTKRAMQGAADSAADEQRGQRGAAAVEDQ